eukprot:scaffold92402_cov31-Phaeocystis_antarctica.AAC.1
MGRGADTRSSTELSDWPGPAHLTSGSAEFQGHCCRRGTPWRGPQSNQPPPRLSRLSPRNAPSRGEAKLS